MRAALAYLTDELSRVTSRIDKGELWLQENPAISYYVRNINGYEYVYGSRRLGKKVISQLISKCPDDLPALREKAQERRRLKAVVSDLKKQKSALSRQIKIAEKALSRSCPEK